MFFVTSFRRGLLIVLKCGRGVGGAPSIVGSRSRVLMLCFSSDAWGFGFVVFDRTRVWASFLAFGRMTELFLNWSCGSLGPVYLYSCFDRLGGRSIVRRIRVSPSIDLAMFL